MRDPKLMLSLLEEMSKSEDGTLPMPALRHAEYRRCRHHVDLLVDADHAKWLSERRQSVRITNAGYDFLNAATNPTHGEKVWSRFIDTFNSGVPYARAAQAAVEFITKLAGV